MVRRMSIGACFSYGYGAKAHQFNVAILTMALRPRQPGSRMTRAAHGRNRIVSARAAWMAAGDAPRAQPQSPHYPVGFDGLDRIGRARRGEAALLPHPGAEKITVEADRGDEQRAHHGAIRARSASASVRTWRFSAVRLRAGGRFTRRQTKSPSGS